jgi:amino acid transporter
MTDGQFVRVLNNKDILALAFGAMIGWGWVVLAGTWVQSAGAAGAIIAFAIGGVAVVLIGLVYAEMVAAMPLCGGEHVYSYRALGMAASFICTWAIILGYVSVVAFEAVALPTVVEHLFPGYSVGHMWTVAGWDVKFTWALVGIAGSVIMTWINIRGIEMCAFVQKVVTVLILVAGIMFVTGSLFNGETANLEPLFVEGTAGILTVLVMTPFMFVGFDVIPQAAEEINVPYKQIGNVLVLSVVMAVAWYIFIILGVSLALTEEQMAASSLVTADAASAVFGGAWAGKLVVLAGIGGIVTSWNAFFIGGSRAIYAMAHARMLPAFLARMHPRYNTPVNAILLIGVLSCLAPLFGRKMLVWLVDAGGLGIVVAYATVVLSFLVLRAKEPGMPRPFVVPHGRTVGIVALILSVGLVVLYLPGSPSALIWPNEWAIVLGWTALGVVFYLWARIAHAGEAHEVLMQELATGHSDLIEPARSTTP